VKSDDMATDRLLLAPEKTRSVSQDMHSELVDCKRGGERVNQVLKQKGKRPALPVHGEIGRGWVVKEGDRRRR
jgi:hypothetical protein